MIARRRRRRPQKRSSSPAASLGHTHGQFQPPGSSAPTESLPRGRQAHQPHHLGLLQLPQAPGSSQLLGMCKAHRGQGGHSAWFPAFWDRQTVPTALLRGVRPSVWGGLQLNLTRASRRSRVCHSGSGQSPAPSSPGLRVRRLITHLPQAPTGNRRGPGPVPAPGPGDSHSPLSQTPVWWKLCQHRRFLSALRVPSAARGAAAALCVCPQMTRGQLSSSPLLTGGGPRAVVGWDSHPGLTPCAVRTSGSSWVEQRSPGGAGSATVLQRLLQAEGHGDRSVLANR